jgi:cysteinyl-tRNA synthetase
MSKSIQQPPWIAPAHHDVYRSGLEIYNSLTRSKVELVPATGKRLNWYICGPTVYDAAHMGHARSYITFDIMRRIMEDYFGYDVLYVMNVTDIDDKIILRARQKFLFQQYVASKKVLDEALIQEIRAMWLTYVVDHFGMKKEDVHTSNDVQAYVAAHRTTHFKDPKYDMYLESVHRVWNMIEKAPHQVDLADFLNIAQDLIATILDQREGNHVTDAQIFRQLASHWETEFWKDMVMLNVRLPDVVTRVSEYVPRIVMYIQKIIERGFAYETNGSVYFDTATFSRTEGHHYAKLEPWSAGNTQLTNEGEGAISLGLGKKKSPCDFALWKKSKPGEPFWDSPWSLVSKENDREKVLYYYIAFLSLCFRRDVLDGILNVQ